MQNNAERDYEGWKKAYRSPRIEVIFIGGADIITTSGIKLPIMPASSGTDGLYDFNR